MLKDMGSPPVQTVSSVDTPQPSVSTARASVAGLRKRGAAASAVRMPVTLYGSRDRRGRRVVSAGPDLERAVASTDADPRPCERPFRDRWSGASAMKPSAHKDPEHTGVGYSPLQRPTAGRIGRWVQRARERTVVLVFRGASRAIAMVPESVSIPIAKGIFRAGYHLWPAKRRIIHANASHVLGLPVDDPAVARLARGIYASYSRFALDLMRLPHAPVDEPLRLLVPDGEDHARFLALWERCKVENRGVLVVSGHIGSIDIFAGAYAQLGMPTYGLADDTAYPELFELLNRQRGRWGVTIIPWRRLRDIFRIMRTPSLLGMVVDWGYRPDDIPVRLFGAWTTLPAGPATLAARTRAFILPVAAMRQPDGTYRAIAREPIEVPDGKPATQLAATQQIADALEVMIRPAPDQWFTFKPMWPSTTAETERLAARAAEMAGG
jgi:phosphatidylinositol dimannoside acyltransferase